MVILVERCSFLQQDGNGRRRQGMVSVLSGLGDYSVMEGRGAMTAESNDGEQNTQKTRRGEGRGGGRCI